MYVTLFCIAVSFLFFIYSGSFLISIIKTESIGNYSVFDLFFIGFCFTGALLNFLSLFFPINIFLIIAIFIAITFYFFKTKKIDFTLIKKKILLIKTKKKMSFLFSFLFVISLLFYYVINPKNYDTWLYHVASIQWIETYRVVPGLANFYDRLGFNSSMFTISAGFTFKELYNQHIYIITSLLYTVFGVWIITKVFSYKNYMSLFLFLFLYFFSLQYIEVISSCGTDAVSNILVAYICISLIINKNIDYRKNLIFIIIPVFVVTLKFSTLPVILIAVFYLFFTKKSFLGFLKRTTLFFSVFLGGWLIRNIIISGYLFYPNPKIDLLSLSWKVPKERVEVTYNWILSYGRIPFKNYPEVLAKPFNEWIFIWWESALYRNKVLYGLALISVLFFILYVIKNYKNLSRSIILFYSVNLLGGLLWLFTAPDVRFSFSFILILALAPIIFILQNISLNKKMIFVVSSLSFLYLFSNTIFESYPIFKTNYINHQIEGLYLPNDFSEKKDRLSIKYLDFYLKTPSGKSIKIYSGNGDDFIYDKFPCTTNYGFNIELRGESLQDGFNTIK